MYYKLKFITWGFQWEDVKTYYFTKRLHAERKMEELKLAEKPHGHGNITEISFEDLKEEISVTEFEKLFGIHIDEP